MYRKDQESRIRGLAQLPVLAIPPQQIHLVVSKHHLCRPSGVRAVSVRARRRPPSNVTRRGGAPARRRAGLMA
jgi:hypothetical protein